MAKIQKEQIAPELYTDAWNPENLSGALTGFTGCHIYNESDGGALEYITAGVEVGALCMNEKNPQMYTHSVSGNVVMQVMGKNDLNTDAVPLGRAGVYFKNKDSAADGGGGASALYVRLIEEPEFADVETRVTHLEAGGIFKGTFPTVASLPTDPTDPAFHGLVTVNDYVTISADETHSGQQWQWVAQDITAGVITWQAQRELPVSVPATTTTVSNLSTVTGATATDALDALDTGKQDVLNRTVIADLASVTAATDTGGNLSAGITGVLPVAHGGTGLATLTSGAAMVGNGTGNVSLRTIQATQMTATATSLITVATIFASTNTALSSSNKLASMSDVPVVITDVVTNATTGACTFKLSKAYVTRTIHDMGGTAVAGTWSGTTTQPVFTPTVAGTTTGAAWVAGFN
jgi:hypothetical protein